MKLKISLITIAAFVANLTFAQVSSDDQNKKSEAMGSGMYTRYVITYDEASNDYTFAGCCSDHYQITFDEFDGKKAFEYKKDGSSMPAVNYFADEEVYPVTFIAGRKRGNEEQVERYKVIEYKSKERIVFLDEWVYVLTDWNSKDDYIIEDVLAVGDIRGIKATKEAFAAKKKMDKANHKETLQAYLDAAFAKQAELLPKWREQNADLVARREANPDILTKVIQGKNDAYWQSDEGKAIIERNKKEDAKKSGGSTKCTIVNDLTAEQQSKYGNVRLAFTGGSVAATSVLRNDSVEISCDDVKVYVGVEGSTEQKRFLFNTEDACGQTINLSQYW